MLFGGGLYAGKLFAGALFGATGIQVPVTPTPPVVSFLSGGGGGGGRSSPDWSTLTRAESYQVMLQKDEEDVLMTVLSLFIEDHDQWDL